MGNFRQIWAGLVCEGKSAALRLQLTDEDDADLPGSDIEVLTLTLYNASNPKSADFGAILNDRDAQDILGENGGMVSAEGLLTLRFSPDDNALLNQRRGFETHVALIEWEWGSGTGKGAKEFSFTVANQSKLPRES